MDAVIACMIPEQGVKLLGFLLAGSSGQHTHSRSKWAGLIYMASKGSGWAGGSPFEYRMSSSSPLEPELAPWSALPPPVPHFDEAI
jgi:hypothetical protein